MASLFYARVPLFTCSRGCRGLGEAGTLTGPAPPGLRAAAPGDSLSGPRLPGTGCCVNCPFKRISGSFKMAGIPFNKLPTFQKINCKINLLPGYLCHSCPATSLCRRLPLLGASPVYGDVGTPPPPGLCWSLTPSSVSDEKPFRLRLHDASLFSWNCRPFAGTTARPTTQHPPRMSHREGMVKVTCKEIHSPCHPNSGQGRNNNRPLDKNR